MRDEDSSRSGAATVASAVMAVAAIALGAVVVVVPLELPVLVALAGAGLVVVGAATLLGVDATVRHPLRARVAAGLLTFLFQQLFLQSQSLLSPHSDVIRVAHVSSIHLVSGGQAGSD